MRRLEAAKRYGRLAAVWAVGIRTVIMPGSIRTGFFLFVLTRTITFTLIVRSSAISARTSFADRDRHSRLLALLDGERLLTELDGRLRGRLEQDGSRAASFDALLHVTVILASPVPITTMRGPSTICGNTCGPASAGGLITPGGSVG